MKICQKKDERRKSARLRALSDLPNGTRARVCDITGDEAHRSHLCSLGITLGAEVEICGHLPGKCRLRVRGCALAMDGDLAATVICENAQIGHGL